MNIEEYQKQAYNRLNPIIATSEKECRNYTCMGLMEEAGEVIAEIRKATFKGNFHEKKLDKESIMKECGDVIWYLLLICRNNNIEVENEDGMELEKDQDREKLIQEALKIGIQAPRIVEEYLNLSSGNGNKNSLRDMAQELLNSIKQMLSYLGITLEEMLETNISKAYSRYDKNGKAVQNLENR